jgi:hypothetical protein
MARGSALDHPAEDEAGAHFARKLGAALRAQANTLARPILATIPPPIACQANKNPLCRAFLMGGTGLEPVTPQLVEMVQAFAPVRARSPTPLSCAKSCLERTLERTRANAEPCHSCHATQSPQTRHRDRQNV